MVIHLWHASCPYTVCMHHQFLHHTLITCTLHAVLAPFLHVLTYFQAYCIVAKIASQGEAESQVPFWNHVLKMPKRQALTVHQCSERLNFNRRQLPVVSIQVYNHETQFSHQYSVFVSGTTQQLLNFKLICFQFLLYDCMTKQFTFIV